MSKYNTKAMTVYVVLQATTVEARTEVEEGDLIIHDCYQGTAVVMHKNRFKPCTIVSVAIDAVLMDHLELAGYIRQMQ